MTMPKKKELLKIKQEIRILVPSELIDEIEKQLCWFETNGKKPSGIILANYIAEHAAKKNYVPLSIIRDNFCIYGLKVYWSEKGLIMVF
jgi:hypothetical protein